MFILSLETTGPDCVFGNGIFQIGSRSAVIDLLCHGASNDIPGCIGEREWFDKLVLNMHNLFIYIDRGKDSPLVLHT